MNITVQDKTAYAYTGGRSFDPHLPCVVFIHGAGHDHSSWSLHARWFAHHGHSVLDLDLPGHGRSQGPLLPDVQAYAQWVLAVLEAVQVPAHAVALVGHSMGSLIALEAAARAPARIHSLAMVGTAYPMAVSQALLDTARHDPLAAMKMVTTWSISSHASKPSHPGPGMWLHGAGLALSRQVQARGAREDSRANVFLHGFEVCNAYRNGLQAAAAVRAAGHCNTHFILGSADQMTQPKASRELAAALNASVTTVPAGHLLMAEAPDAVLAALRKALAPIAPTLAQ